MPFTTIDPSAEREPALDADARRASAPEPIDVRRPSGNDVELPTGLLDPDACTPIGEVRFRQRVQVKGRVRSLRVRPWADVPSLELVLVDGTGGLTVVFLGRRHVAGIRPGSLLAVEGMVGSQGNRLAILNPHYDLRHFELAS